MKRNLNFKKLNYSKNTKKRSKNLKMRNQQ